MQSGRMLRQAASGAVSAQARSLPLLASALSAAHRQPASSALWQPTAPLGALSSVTARAAATSGDVVAQDQELPNNAVYETDYDPAYVMYCCITGTVQSAEYIAADSGPWLKITMKVATPHSEGFTTWHVLTRGELAQAGKEVAVEGALVQAAGTFLPPESIQRAGFTHLLQIPAMFAESMGSVASLEPTEALKRIVLPQLSEADLNAFIGSAGQQVHTPPPAPPAPAPAASQPIRAPGMPPTPGQAATDVERAWMSVFLENHLWIDQRDTKQGKQPDFRQRVKATDGSKDALWLVDKQLPSWVKRNLQLLPGGKPYSLPPFIPFEALSGTPKEQQWVEVFTNYPAFWDNRVNKINPRGPDFSPKDKANGGTALWIVDRETPDWVAANLGYLPPAPDRKAA